MNKKFLFVATLLSMLAYSCASNKNKPLAIPQTVTLSTDELMDKIKGGWAGQTIGVTFGSYTEFRYQGTFIQDYQSIPWYEGYVAETMDVWPDLYDDIYMDLTFVDVLEQKGLDAKVCDFAQAFAHAGYNLWHANQAARYNILHGIANPGHWQNNPHADDIDYQIEADFAGLMNPGMPNSASLISDSVGHIMCYGDGWYGGVYVGAMYSLAFVFNDIYYIVQEALKVIPEESSFYRCISDVIHWHQLYPDDWKQTWFELQKKYSEDIGCSEGVFAPLNIDAKLNAAYIVLGLLYGEGDFTRTMEISTRAGQDSDCNPSSAGGILGTMIGYSHIPEYWMKGLKGAEDKVFKYTSLSLNQIYDTSYKHALEMIRRNGGSIKEEQVYIRTQQPKPVQLEQSFPKMYPVERFTLNNPDIQTLKFSFEGTGFVLRGEAALRDHNKPDTTIKAKLYIDGVLIEEAVFPTSYHDRRLDLFWKYQLPAGQHEIKVEVPNTTSNALLRSWDYIVYTNHPHKRRTNK